MTEEQASYVVFIAPLQQGADADDENTRMTLVGPAVMVQSGENTGESDVLAKNRPRR